MSFKVKDFYFKQAKKQNFVARSIYKLEEIDKKFDLFTPESRVLDLGCFPGSWIQYTAPKLKKGLVVGIDLQGPLRPDILQFPNLVFLQGNFLEREKQQELCSYGPFDVVLSDMAPNTSGIKTVDQAKSLELVEEIFKLLPFFLKPQGNLLLKIFEDQKAQDFLRQQKKSFKLFEYLRPKATRSVSKEYFVIGKMFQEKRLKNDERQN